MMAVIPDLALVGWAPPATHLVQCRITTVPSRILWLWNLPFFRSQWFGGHCPPYGRSERGTLKTPAPLFQGGEGLGVRATIEGNPSVIHQHMTGEGA